MTSGFSPVRPATPVNEALLGTFTDWSHVVGRGVQIPPGGDSSNVPRFDVLAGPLNSSSEPMSLRNIGSSLRLRIDNGAVYLRGRWIVPTTRRHRGINSGGTFHLLNNSPAETFILNTCEENATLVHEGTLVDYSDANKDIIMYPAGHSATANTPIKIVLRHLKINAACISPDDLIAAGNSCEDPECVEITPGNYYVITTNAVTGRQTITTFPWAIPANSTLTHDPHAKALVTLINQKITTVNMPTVMKPLAPLTGP
jgi:hypothetical protein